MDRPEFITKLKEVLFGSEELKEQKEVKASEEVAETTEEKLAVEAALANGDIVMAEPSFDVGAAVMIKQGEADFTPIPAGEYELADGAKFVVEEDGVIASFEPMAEEEPAPVEEEMSAEQSNEDLLNAFKEVLSPITERLLKIEQSNESKDKEIGDLKAELSKAKEAGESVQKLARVKQVEKVDLSKMTPAQRIAHNLKNR